MATRRLARSTRTLIGPRKAKESPRRSSEASRNSTSASILREATLNVPQAADRTGQGILISRMTGSMMTGATRPSTRPLRKDRVRLSAGRPGFCMPITSSPLLSGERAKRPWTAPRGTSLIASVVEAKSVENASRPSLRSSRPWPLARPFQEKGMRSRSSRMSVSMS